MKTVLNGRNILSFYVDSLLKTIQIVIYLFFSPSCSFDVSFVLRKCSLVRKIFKTFSFFNYVKFIFIPFSITFLAPLKTFAREKCHDSF